MAGLGRMPKPDGQRRNHHPVLGTGKTRRISVSDHASAVPKWPLIRATKRELEFWDRLWKTPQSALWEELGWNDGVARYARLMTIAEGKKSPAIVLIEVRQLEDRLGLSPMSMLRLRWEIVPDEEPTPVAANVVDVRERLKAIE